MDEDEYGDDYECDHWSSTLEYDPNLGETEVCDDCGEVFS